MFLQQVINGITVGCIYGLVSLGYTLIFGVIGLINFAHGEIYMFGAFIAFSVLSILGGPFFLAVIAVIIGAALLGYLMDRIVYRPIRTAPRVSQLITALAISMVLRNLAMLIWGTRTMAFPSVFSIRVLEFAGIRVTQLQLAIPAVTLLLMIGLHKLIYSTRLGKAVRATSLDSEIASAMGIEPNHVIAAVFALGASLGGVAGLLVALFYGSISFDMGVTVGLRAFVACIIGGIGSIHGAMLGGLIIGLAEVMATGYISPGYKNAIAFIILTLVLVVKPSGIFGFLVEKSE
ncbi:MAG: branched-chain amino acid ABC transporter permease [Firmicutes bacterium]|nr:branched-chain amino acid ABC transporter permease [Bacillota bacterium]